MWCDPDVCRAAGEWLRAWLAAVVGGGHWAVVVVVVMLMLLLALSVSACSFTKG